MQIMCKSIIGNFSDYTNPNKVGPKTKSKHKKNHKLDVSYVLFWESQNLIFILVLTMASNTFWDMGKPMHEDLFLD